VAKKTIPGGVRFVRGERRKNSTGSEIGISPVESNEAMVSCRTIQRTARVAHEANQAQPLRTIQIVRLRRLGMATEAFWARKTEVRSERIALIGLLVIGLGSLATGYWWPTLEGAKILPWIGLAFLTLCRGDGIRS